MLMVRDRRDALDRAIIANAATPAWAGSSAGGPACRRHGRPAAVRARADRRTRASSTSGYS
jgi:hypothetical protein